MSKFLPQVTVSLTVKKSAEALAFYTEAFGAKELHRLTTDTGEVAHAEFAIGETTICISDETDEWFASALPDGAMAPMLFSITTEDCDASFNQAIAAGARALSPPEDQFWGARSAIVADPFGYRWSFTQITEEMTPEEIAARGKELFGK
ncbi:VOC family protein [Verrucomicrobiales bacterium]|nr:VOC family protein [Verrucomicrobiales bacterium]